MELGDVIREFSGPLGGAMATSFGSGCLAGYFFAFKSEVGKLKTEIQDLKDRLEPWENIQLKLATDALNARAIK